MRYYIAIFLIALLFFHSDDLINIRSEASDTRPPKSSISVTVSNKARASLLENLEIIASDMSSTMNYSIVSPDGELVIEIKNSECSILFYNSRSILDFDIAIYDAKGRSCVDFDASFNKFKDRVLQFPGISVASQGKPGDPE
ncbi:hypothetical protein [Methylobrevis albus]|uniref:Uncharacterized protein n=1 Tax=Methylobrevis albus TaxID=2793297 RepID=A0A931MWQ1_9HYPH|nr:hypothetical protein [Methylobrevis albus]MBH0237578.1 hypothetical protein [Methylobrevis albus]